MFRVDDPRSEPRVLHQLSQKQMAEDAEGDSAIGGFHAISGDTNNSGEMNNAGGQTKRANGRSFVYRPPAWRR